MMGPLASQLLAATPNTMPPRPVLCHWIQTRAASSVLRWIPSTEKAISCVAALQTHSFLVAGDAHR